MAKESTDKTRKHSLLCLTGCENASLKVKSWMKEDNLYETIISLKSCLHLAPENLKQFGR